MIALLMAGALAVLEPTAHDNAGNPVVLAASVSGEVHGSTLVLSIHPGPMATKAIRVYSEPSHTLLLAVVDADFKNSVDGKAWWADKLGAKSGPTVVTDLPEGQPKIQVPARPSDDDRIAVWLKGLFPTDSPGKAAESEMLIADGKVGTGSFSFQTSFPLVAPADDPDDPQHCCTAAGGCQDCSNCKGAFFTCCLKTTFGCGTCNDYEVHCGDYICELCQF